MEKKKKLNSEIIVLVEKCIKIAGTKLILARHLDVEWTTVDRWKEGRFKPSIENYLKLRKILDKGKL
jgi:DNA-binding transcriptional regulator YiaG